MIAETTASTASAEPRTRPRILVAGIGNIFLGDDGFGVEVVRRLSGHTAALGDDVRVADFGIRGVHLAYELAGAAYDAVILVDAVSRGGEPGSLYAIEADLGSIPIEDAVADAHSLTPDAVLAWIRRVGAPINRVMVVGCEPASIDESMELSVPVAAAVNPAMAIVRDMVARVREPLPCV